MVDILSKDYLLKSFLTSFPQYGAYKTYQKVSNLRDWVKGKTEGTNGGSSILGNGGNGGGSKDSSPLIGIKESPFHEYTYSPVYSPTSAQQYAYSPQLGYNYNPQISINSPNSEQISKNVNDLTSAIRQSLDQKGAVTDVGDGEESLLDRIGSSLGVVVLVGGLGLAGYLLLSGASKGKKK